MPSMIIDPAILNSGQVPADDPNPGVSSGRSAADSANEYWDDRNVFKDFFTHQDTFAHNEALAAYEREKTAAAEAFAREADYNAREAEKQRAYEEAMSNTAFQRKVADYKAAGFSPLAALEGSVGASTPSGSAASASYGRPSAPAASNGSNPVGGLLGSLVAAMALIMTKGISAGLNLKAASAKEARDLEKQIADQTYGFTKQADEWNYKKDFEIFKKRLWNSKSR